METQLLEQAGLTNGESRVYLSLLHLGSTTIGPILDKSGVTKSIIYRILDRLMEKGLASYIIKEKTRYYEAAMPEKLLEYVEEQEREIHKTKEQLSKVLPSLKLIQQSKTGSQVKIFEGFKGMITVHEKRYEKLKRGDSYFFLGIPPEQPKYFHAYWQRDHMRRAKAGIKCDLLYHPDTARKILENRNTYRGNDARYMPINIETPAWLMGYKDVIVIGLPGDDPITIEITNERIAKSFRSYFQWFWKRSKKQ